MSDKPSVLVTGAAGYIGALLLPRLSQERDLFANIVAFDLHPISQARQLPGVEYVVGDIRDRTLLPPLHEFRIDTVVHLASIVTPTKNMTRDFIYSVDVEGTRSVLLCCLETGVKQVVVTSSGAAYGYYADNIRPLVEEDALRGNSEFAYSDHKRLVEEMLAEFRTQRPELKQLILRVCTVLGDTTDNQITAIFRKPIVFGVRGTETPFVFIWDNDLVECIVKGIIEKRTGIYNIAGDGQLTLRQIARRLSKPYVPIPPRVLADALWLLKMLGITRYGPEQVNFLRYRPVLSNERLKREFGYEPALSSSEAFERYIAQVEKEHVKYA